MSTKEKEVELPRIVRSSMNTIRTHITKLRKAADSHQATMTDHADSLDEAAQTVERLLGQDTGKRRVHMQVKEGRAFSTANRQALEDHADSLHDLADGATSTVSRHTKSILAVADDLQGILDSLDAEYGETDMSDESSKRYQLPEAPSLVERRLRDVARTTALHQERRERLLSQAREELAAERRW